VIFDTHNAVGFTETDPTLWRNQAQPVCYSILAVDLGEDEWGDPTTGAVIGEFITLDGPVRSSAASAIRSVIPE
jgi:hypothetical protein